MENNSKKNIKIGTLVNTTNKSEKTKTFSIKKALLIFAGISVVTGIGVFILGIFFTSIPKGTAEEKWLAGNDTKSIASAYGTTIANREHSMAVDSIKLTTADGWSFWYTCKNGGDRGYYCEYSTEKDSKRFSGFGDLLYSMNRTEIHKLADQYNGVFTEDSYTLRTVEFEQYSNASSFATAVRNLIYPASNACSTYKSMDRNVRATENCYAFSPVTVAYQGYSGLEEHDIFYY